MSEAPRRERTQVAIIGAGPAGLLLAEVLRREGVEAIVLERRDRAYVEGRIRAGILERGTVEMMRGVGAAARLEREALIHDGIEIAINGRRQRLDFHSLIGATVTVYGQTEVTKDLGDNRAAGGGRTIYEALDVSLHDIETERPRVRFVHAGEHCEIEADFIAGCDGFHGVSRASIPVDRLRIYERVYPFAWLGVMADTPPVADDLIYAQHDRGFALCSMRSLTRSRHYLQVAPNENLEDWSADRIWSEIGARIGDPKGEIMKTGPLIEKSLTQMRSFVCETMRYGRLFLAGDAGHIVPPTGAKGLNLAASDVHYLSQALIAFYHAGSAAELDAYPARALARVWKAQRFSWWMTSMLHNFGADEAFQDRVHRAELEYVLSSRAAQTSLAENYVGLPY
ncbi:MAG TPA: 4-hydroxybenzoate 3-monooxygenase [Roseiarcus sp.]|jgi:p-hydroxybenzoate 3-monooxygenase